MWKEGTAAAIGRSIETYLRDRERIRAMEAALSRFVRPGALAFDIGAHLGDRTAALARLGARVLALEPQPAPFRALRLIHRGTAGVTVLNAAAGASEGWAEMFLNTANPTVSTLSDAFVAAARGGEGWAGQVWDGRVAVPVTTLDALIAEHGVPDFVKIDVEGHEPEVLAGLSRPLPALSFEVTHLQRGAGRACLDRLEALGPHAYALSLGEGHVLPPGDWVAAAAMRERIAGLTPAENSGDVYARPRG